MIAYQVPDLCHRNDHLVRFKVQGKACVGALAGAPHAAAVRDRHFRELDLEEEEEEAGEEGHEEMRVQPVSAALCRRKRAMSAATAAAGCSMGASVGSMSQVDAQPHINNTCHALIASLEASLMLVSSSSPSGVGGGQSGAAAGCQWGVQARAWSPCDILV